MKQIHEFLLDRLEACDDEIQGAARETRRILPGNTCPDINAIIKTVNQVLRRLRKSEDEDLISDIQGDLESLEGELEELRDKNARLRDLSSLWREIAEGNYAIMEKAVAELPFDTKEDAL